MHGRCKVKPRENVPAMRSCMCICVCVNGSCHKGHQTRRSKAVYDVMGTSEKTSRGGKSRGMCPKCEGRITWFVVHVSGGE